jgi:hypothetical protein
MPTHRLRPLHLRSHEDRDAERRQLIITLLLAALVAAGACEEVSTSDPMTDTATVTDTAADTATTADSADADLDAALPPPDPEGGVQALLDLTTAMSGEAATFFSFPFPSDLRTSAQGHPILQGMQTRNSPLVKDALAWVEGERPGFSPSTAAYIGLNGALDPGSLPQSALESATATATAFVIGIDPNSPDFGVRHPVDVRFKAKGDNFTPDNLLIFSVVMGVPLRNGARYAAVLTSGARSAAGNPAVAHPEVEAAKRQQATDPAMGAHLNEAMAALRDAGVSTDDVVAVAAFRTADPTLDLQHIRTWLYTQPAPAVGPWERAPDLDEDTYDVYTARVDLNEFFSGQPPYTAQFGEGAFLFDANGAPQDTRAISTRLVLTTPKGAMPAAGWPLVIYGHGTGGDAYTQLGKSYEADFLAAEGIAMLGFDAPLHGERGSGAIEPDVLLLANAVAGRELFRQHAVDLFTLFRLQEAGGFDIPAQAAGNSAPITFRRDLDLYMGHSQGSQVAGMTLALEPLIGAAFFSGGGGGGILSVFDREFNGTPIICTIASLIRVGCDQLTEDHPLPRLILQPLLDPADPVAYARNYFQELHPGGRAKHLAMTEGTLDPYTPPRAIEALAAAAGVPLMEAVVQTSAALEVTNNPRQRPPQTQNVISADGSAITSGLMQFEGEGHFVIYRKADARNRYVQFFKSATANGGVPTIVGP